MGKVKEYFYPDLIEDSDVCSNCGGAGDSQYPCYKCHNSGVERREPSPEDWADFREDEDVE